METSTVERGGRLNSPTKERVKEQMRRLDCLKNNVPKDPWGLALFTNHLGGIQYHIQQLENIARFEELHSHSPSLSPILGSFQILPIEIHLLIFSFLPLKDTVSVLMVCSQWSELKEHLWKQIYYKYYHPILNTEHLSFGIPWSFICRTKSYNIGNNVIGSVGYWESVGERKEGRIVNEQIEGYGMYMIAGKKYKEGMFKNGKLDGYGIEYYRGGKYLFYTGEWSEGKKCGKGTQYFINGKGKGVDYENHYKFYEGEWREDKKHGQGKEFYENGNVFYSGSWAHGEADGHGVEYYLSTHKKYEGEWRWSNRSGSGTEFYDFTGNRKYHGGWAFGVYHGPGTFWTPSGDKLTGTFVDSSIFSGSVLFTNGDLYVGEIVFQSGRFVLEGKGRMKYNNMQVYEGSWTNNNPHGQGTLKLLDGGKYVGVWKHGTMLLDSLFVPPPKHFGYSC